MLEIKSSRLLYDRTEWDSLKQRLLDLNLREILMNDPTGNLANMNRFHDGELEMRTLRVPLLERYRDYLNGILDRIRALL